MASVIAASYDYWLVALSLFVAFVTSYAALDLAARVTANQGFHRAMWLMGGAFAMGSGIWCMHYTGMLAFRLPIPVYYHVPTVVVSLLAAIAASGIALYVVSRPFMTATHLAAGSVLMGAAIATMHYTGMAAMRLAAMHFYDRNLWILSIFVAVMGSYAGLLIIYHSGGDKQSWRPKTAAAFSLGIAIPAAHYTGMAAVHFVAVPATPNLVHSVDISTLARFAIFGVTFIVLGFALITAMVERKMSAQQSELDREREILRALLDNIPDLMYVKDVDSRFVLANPQVAKLMGVSTAEDLIGKTAFDFLPADRITPFYEMEQKVIHSGQPIFNHEEVFPDSQGHRMPVLTTTVPLHDQDGHVTGIAGVGRNISERKKSEEALTAAEKKYRGIFDEALFGMFQLDRDGYLLNLNPAMAHLSLYAGPEEMLQEVKEPLWNWAVQSTRHQELVSVMKDVGHVRAFELEVYRKDRSTMWISVTVRATIRDGALQGYEGMFEDITERRVLRDQLLQAQKLESVGQLAAGIAHEINTPTQYIGDNVRFLKKTFGNLTNLLNIYDGLWKETLSDTVTATMKQEISSSLRKIDIKFLLAEVPKAIDDTLEGVKRVSTLVGAMKEFSHPGTKEKIPLDLNHAIQSTITVAQNEWKYVADVETRFDHTLPPVSCLPGEFNQVILNLIVNAAHAIGDRVKEGKGEKGKITVETRPCPTGVEIRIGDTGTGIPLDVRAKIFDPFFTTKEIGKGTGQGLAIARSIIVDKHEGSIDFESVVGVGTTFIVRLPYHEKPSLAELATP
jgi:PAS domain S-box-containing protein